tara:strand:- start:581 stop:772 length:192 start_codon:yes stop_codon:yes gene_type:complete
MYSVFNSFFTPTRIIVVSEERLREEERRVKEEQVEAVGIRITELQEYKKELEKELLKLPSKKD